MSYWLLIHKIRHYRVVAVCIVCVQCDGCWCTSRLTDTFSECIQLRSCEIIHKYMKLCWCSPEGMRRGLKQPDSHRHLVCQMCSELMLWALLFFLFSPQTHTQIHIQHPVCLSAFSLAYIRVYNHGYQRVGLSLFSCCLFCLPPVYIPKQCCLQLSPWQRSTDRLNEPHLWYTGRFPTHILPTGVNEREEPRIQQNVKAILSMSQFFFIQAGNKKQCLAFKQDWFVLR